MRDVRLGMPATECYSLILGFGRAPAAQRRGREIRAEQQALEKLIVAPNPTENQQQQMQRTPTRKNDPLRLDPTNKRRDAGDG